MRSDLNHLTIQKQQELAHVSRVLFEEFEAAHRLGTSRWKKQGRILKLVLYGSYARGDWVDDAVSGYRSDYDILVVVNDERLTAFEMWSAAEDRLMRDATITDALSAPVGLIVHSLTDVNAQLERGRPFFIDIVRDGVVLYEAEGFCFAGPRDLPSDEARIEAQRYFGEWFRSAEAFNRMAHAAIESGDLKEAAFVLHQTTERLYHCVLLTLTLYSPKSHKLNFLRGHAESIVPALIEAWPRADKRDRRCFELLRQAYVNARYSPHYAITADELAWIGGRVGVLQQLVASVCEDRLAG